MLSKIKKSLFVKSLFFVMAISAFSSALLVWWYGNQITSRTLNQVIVQRNAIVESLEESLIEPLRFHNVKDMSRVLSAYAGRSLEWAVLFDITGVPLYTVGNVPDINGLGGSDYNPDLKHETFESTFEVKDGTEILGRISFGLRLKPYQDSLAQEKQNLVIVTVFSFLTIILLLGLYAKYIVGRINYLNNKISVFDPTKSAEPSTLDYFDELDNIFAVFSKTANHLNSDQIKLAEKSKSEALAKMATQVAHDIRSPLSALNMVAGTLVETSEEKRLLIRHAVQRINDIANDLLSKGEIESAISKARSNPSVSEHYRQLILLPALVESLVSEKRIQYRDRINVRIETDLMDSFGAFVEGDGKQIMRLLSNLVNNSVEAFKGQDGEVIVAVRVYQSQVQLIVKDTGIGMPAEILAKLGQIGVTHGKSGTESGSGLGVYHAKKSIEDFGGSFNIRSVVGTGTQIDMILPRAQKPEWFLDTIRLKPGQQLISLDDDLSIHQIWKGRLESLGFEDSVVLKSFTSGKEFVDFVDPENKSMFKTDNMYLVDYELFGQSLTGLDLIQQLKIGGMSALITSRYEEPSIRKKCEALNVKLLPKSLAGFVPIVVERQI